MSRSGRRLERFHEAIKRKPAGGRAPRRESLWERVKIWAALLSSLGVLLGTSLMNRTITHRNAVTGRVDRWRRQLALSEAEANQLVRIELAYHGNGNPFVSEPRRSRADNEVHEAELMAAVRPAVAPVFRRLLGKVTGQ